MAKKSSRHKAPKKATAPESHFAELRGVQIFEAGSYPQGDYTEADIEQLAANYDPAFHEAPNCLTHDDPKTGERKPSNLAFGWIKRVWTDGKKLFADLKDVPDQFVKWLGSGRVKKRSIEIYADLEGRGPYIRALAWPLVPQVKGMDDIAQEAVFADDEPEFERVEFAETESLKAAVEEREKVGKLQTALDEFNRLSWEAIGSTDKGFSEKRQRIQDLVSEFGGLDILSDTESTSMSDKDKGKTVDQNVKTPPANNPPDTKTKVKGPADEPVVFSEAQQQAIGQIVTKAVTEALAENATKVHEHVQTATQRASRVADVDRFCDDMINQGRMTPGEAESERIVLRRLADVEQFDEASEKLLTARRDLYLARDPALFQELDRKSQPALPRDKALEAAVAKATEEFAEADDGSTTLGAFKAMILQDEGFKEGEIRGALTEAERVDAGFAA